MGSVLHWYSAARIRYGIVAYQMVELSALFICSFLVGNTKESQNMVTPAMQLAHKIPDINVQLWATALLRDLYNICGDQQKAQVRFIIISVTFSVLFSIHELVSVLVLHLFGSLQEAYQSHTAFSQQLLKDHFSASQRPEHALINWTQGPVPSHIIHQS